MSKSTTHTPGPWSSSPQVGEPGHCFAAQVWDSEGENLVVVQSTEDERVATANAQLMATSPELLGAAQGILDAARDVVMPLECVEAYFKLKDAVAKARGEDT